MKNEKDVLPLTPEKKIAVIGFGSDNAVVHGGGSGSVVPSSIVTPLEGINAVAHTPATYSDGTDLGEAVGMAKAADVAIVFVATLSHEGGDRTSLSLDDGCDPDTRPGHTGVGHPCEGNNHNQNAMVSAIAKANPNTVVSQKTCKSVLVRVSHVLKVFFQLRLSCSVAGCDVSAGCGTDTMERRGTSNLDQLYAGTSSWRCHRRRTLRQGQSISTPSTDLPQQGERAELYPSTVPWAPRS